LSIVVSSSSGPLAMSIASDGDQPPAVTNILMPLAFSWTRNSLNFPIALSVNVTIIISSYDALCVDLLRCVQPTQAGFMFL
jgi:hypothetical protein